MRLLSFLNHAASKRTLAVAALVLLGSASLPTRAADVIGLYVGGSVGQGRVEADAGSATVGEFRENHSAFKLVTGIHPIPGFGVEAEYIDFGHPTGTLGGSPADVRMKGAAAFAVWTLPIPVIDVFLKGGLARLQSTTAGVGGGQTPCIPCSPNLFSLDRTNTSFAAGAGVQFKAGAWAIRGEYERFDAAGGNPRLLSLGVTWTFL